MGKMEQLYQQGGTIFTIDDLRVLWQEPHPDRLKTRVKYYVDQGSLVRLRRGVFSLKVDYDRLELAGKLIIPSYVSFETALLRHGVIFQYTSAITSASVYSRRLVVGREEYMYHRIAEDILLNPLGIMHTSRARLATPERAVADWIYIGKTPAFDNLRVLTAHGLRQASVVYEKYPHVGIQLEKIIHSL